jgi:succinate dehydrogenase hydrophobic anchor subunit
MAVSELPTTPDVRTYPGGHRPRSWHWTAGTGIALVVLASVHLIAQHFIVHQTGGLRTYREVLDYIANPVIFVIECGFLFAVTIHAMLGVRSVLFDLNLEPTTRQRVDVGLWVLGSITILYGLALLITLAVRA